MADSKTLRFIGQEMIRQEISNTYEAIMVAAREARRLNRQAKMFGEEEELGAEKKTTTALIRLLNGELKYKFKPNKDADG